MALSSAEAELNGICKASQEALAAKYMAEELGQTHHVSVSTDASAAVGIVLRHGIGKIKHLHVKQMWVQERVRERELSVHKIPRAINAADLMTHHFTEKEAGEHLGRMNVIRINHNGDHV